MYVRLLTPIKKIELAGIMIEKSKDKSKVFITLLKLFMKGIGLNRLRKLEIGLRELSI